MQQKINQLVESNQQIQKEIIKEKNEKAEKEQELEDLWEKYEALKAKPVNAKNSGHDEHDGHGSLIDDLAKAEKKYEVMYEEHNKALDYIKGLK